MLNYTKFIYQNPPETPPQTPRQDVPGSIERQAASSQEIVESRKRDAEKMEKLKKDKDELFNYWVNNSGKFSPKEDNPLYESLDLFDDKTIAREAFALLSLVKKYWGEDKAKELYAGAWINSGKTFSLTRLCLFFADTKHMKLRQATGHGSAQGLSESYCNGEQAKRELGIYWKDGNWYVWNNKKGSTDENIGEYLHLNIVKLKSALKNQNVEYLVDEGRKDEVTSFLETEMANIKMTKKELDPKILQWAQTKAANKWEALPDEIHNYMRLRYGKRTGYYVYRYDADKKRIYALKINGAPLQSDDGDAAYIDVKEGELGNWNGYTNGKDFLKSDLLDKMAPVGVQREIVDYKGKEQPGSLSEDQKLLRTKGMVAVIMASGNFAYESMEKDYLDVVEEKLVQKLKEESSLTEEQAKEIAKLRKTKLKESIDKYIDEKSEALKQAKEDNPKIKFNINVNSNDDVEIKFDNIQDKAKYSQFAQDAKEKAEGADLDKIVDQKTEDITKKLGPLGFLLKFFKIDIKSDVTEYFKTGKKSIFLTIAGAISGVEIGRRVLTGKGIEKPEDLKKLAEENGGKLKNDHEFKKDVAISGYKITIPKGKGIKPGKDFKASGVDIKKEEEKKEEKPKFSFTSLFSSKSKKEFVMEDVEIVIAPNDTVPEGTVIPKDAKIEKVA